MSFTHLIAYAIARAVDDMPVMANHFAEIDGKPHRIEDGQVNLGLAVDVEKRDGSRTLMVPVILDAGRRPFDRFLEAYDALVEKARTNTLTADDLVGGNVTLTNPGGLGTVASVPRLMTGQGTIVATGSIAYPVGLGDVGAMIGAEKVDDDDLDLRPSHHPGRGVRALSRADRGVPAGRARLLRGRVRVAGRGARSGPRAARARRRGRRRRILDASGGIRAPRRGAAAGGAGGQHARHALPQPWPPGGAP